MDLKQNKTFCMAPWVHTYIGPDNRRNLCCVSNINFDENQELKDAWNSNKIKNVRKKMLNGEEIEECYRCDPDAEHSYRKYWNYKFSDKIGDVISKTNQEGEFSGLPISVDYRTNICNFKCKTCNEIFSSSIHQEYHKLGLISDDHAEYHSNILANNGRIIKNEIDFLIENSEIVDMYWAGGEPLHFKEHWESLEKLINLNKSENVYLRYSSNLSTLTWKNNHLLDFIDKFKFTELYCSLDGTSDIGEWVRTNLIYGNFLNNLKQIVDYKNANPNKIKVVIQPVLTLPTLIDLPNLNKLANDNDVLLEIQEPFNTNKLLNPRSYPKSIMSEIYTDVKQKLAVQNGYNTEFVLRYIENLEDKEHIDEISSEDKTKLEFLEINRPQKNIKFLDIISVNENLKNFYLNL